MYDLRAQLDSQPPELKVTGKIKSRLITYILDELLKIFDLLTNLGNFIELVK